MVIASITIPSYKLSLAIDLINNEAIVKGIDSQSPKYDPEATDSLINENIFSSLQIPDTQSRSDTYLLMKVDMRNINRQNSSFVDMVLVIWVLSHKSRLKMKNQNANRIDYLGEELREMLDGSTKYGAGELRLISNGEYILSTNPDYSYRELVFKTFDLAKDTCGR